MSALNAAASANAVGVHVNAVDVEPEQEKKKPKIVREPQVHMEQTIEQEDKGMEVGRTLRQARHLGHNPIPHHTIRVPRRIV